jgi:alcohol dehydrogenase class IV
LARQGQGDVNDHVLLAADHATAPKLKQDRPRQFRGAECADLQVPSPEAYGISREKWEAVSDTMAEQALASGSPGNNPRVPTADEIKALYDQAYS